MRNSRGKSVPGVAALVLSCFLPRLAAQGTGPSVQLSAATLSFGSQVVGTSSAPLTETMTGPQSVVFSGITLSGTNAADFTVQSNTCSGTSPATRWNCQITIVFHPSGAGIRSAAVGINDNRLRKPPDLPLAGYWEPCRTEADFGGGQSSQPEPGFRQPSTTYGASDIKRWEPEGRHQRGHLDQFG
jgi:hypothetical protein